MPRTLCAQYNLLDFCWFLSRQRFGSLFDKGMLSRVSQLWGLSIWIFFETQSCTEIAKLLCYQVLVPTPTRQFNYCLGILLSPEVVPLPGLVTVVAFSMAACMILLCGEACYAPILVLSAVLLIVYCSLSKWLVTGEDTMLMLPAYTSLLKQDCRSSSKSLNVVSLWPCPVPL